MVNMLYLKIKAKKLITEKKEKKNFLERVLSFVIPRANPDFENKIQKVSNWLLEFDDERSTPNREVGLDYANEVILKMPYKKNYGYWTDNNLIYRDFVEIFYCEIIDKKIFEQNWAKLN